MSQRYNNTKPLSRRAVLVGAGAVAAAPAFALPANRARFEGRGVLIQRAFANVGYGQLHYRVATPIDRRMLTKPPLVCFHQSPVSSQIFVEFMAEMAADRIVYAPDTPGYGASDLPAEAPDMPFYAAAMIDFLNMENIGPYDLVGYHTGASIATEIAASAPGLVRRMMLVGIAIINDQEREFFFANPWPLPRQDDGSHLVEEWKRSKKWQGPGQSEASLARTFSEKISAGDTASWGARAVVTYDLAGRLAAVDKPMTLVNPQDDLWTITPRAREVKPDAPFIALEEYGFGVFEAAPAMMAGLAREALDG